MSRLKVRRATAFLLVLLALCSLAVLSAGGEHECSGDSCAICAALKLIVWGTPILGAVFALCLPSSREGARVPAGCRFDGCDLSLVSLHTKLSD